MIKDVQEGGRVSRLQWSNARIDTRGGLLRVQRGVLRTNSGIALDINPPPEAIPTVARDFS